MVYALSCNVDYWVYIEQDALISGKGIIEHAIASMKSEIMLGGGRGTPQPLQQSFMIMKTSIIPKFMERFTSLQAKDAEIAPELKFWIAANAWARYLPEAIFRDSDANLLPFDLMSRIRNKILEKGSRFDILPFGYGRVRPINFNDQFYYFQHGTEEELENYMAAR